MSSTGPAKPKMARDNPFLAASQMALRVAGDGRDPRGHKSLSAFTWAPEHQQESYSAGQLAISFPYLQAAASIAAIEDAHVLGEALPDAERQRRDQDVYRSHKLAELRMALMKGNYVPRPVHEVLIPKMKFTEPLPDAEALAAIWRDPLGSFHDPLPPDGDPKGKRPLKIAHWQDKAVQGGLNLLLSAYLAPSWKPHVVGFRGGISIPRIWATLEQAMISSGCRIALMADICDFFGSIPLGRLHEILQGRVGHRGDALLERLLEMYVPREGRGLPQGSPLSPLLANLYGEETIDRFWTAGPLMRYADDVVILVRDVQEARTLFASMTERLKGHGLLLHPAKSIIHDFCSGRSYAAASGDPLEDKAIYLGAALSWSDEERRLHLSCTDRAVRKLLQGLKEVRPKPLSLESPGTTWMESWKGWRFRMLGWLGVYGGMEMSSRQKEALALAMSLTQMSCEGLRRVVEGHRFFNEPSDVLLAKVCAAMGMSEKQAKAATWETILPLGCADEELLPRCQARLAAALKSPLAIPYRVNRHTRLTVREPKPISEDKISIALSDPAYCLSPLPEAEIELSTWSPRNWYGSGAQPSTQPEPL